MSRRERDLRKLAKKHGLQVRQTRNNHWGFVDALGRIVAVASGSPSDHRADKALTANLRRANV